MKVAIIGAGAVGLGVGSCLLAAGEPVAFVARPETAAALRRSGLTRTGLFGEAVARPGDFEVADSLGHLGWNSIDFVLVCTKTPASESVAQRLADFRRDAPCEFDVVLMHNGWGSAECFAARLPRQRIYNARIITGFRRRATHHVEITVHADAIHLGSLFGADEGRLAALAAAIARGGLPCEISDTLAEDLWAKMLYNCALNPLGALLRVPYGGLAERAATRALLEAVVREIFDVMPAAGHRTHWDSAKAYLRDFYGEILPPTKRHESSMLQDLRAGRRTEIDALCGAVADLGLRFGVATPVNSALCQLIRALEPRQPPTGEERIR